MPTTRRQFIKRSAAAVSVSLVMPKLWMRDALGQTANAADRKIFVVIQLGGGNDGLNTVVPFTNSRYLSLRPTIGFRDADLRDAQGNPTMISNDLALHPSLAELKSLYDSQRVAIIQGVGYPNPNLSHFLSMDIWHTANTSASGYGWLGKYADQKLLGASGFTAASLGGTLPKTLSGNNVVIPSISVGAANAQPAARFAAYNFLTDGRYAGDRNNQLNTFRATNSRSLPAGSFAAEIADTGIDAVDGAQQVQNSVDDYTSTITYPIGTAPNVNNLAIAMQMVAQLATTLPDANLFYVSLGGFDHHSQEIGSNADPDNKLIGQHATLLRYFSQAVKAFYDDMAAHGLADNVVMMQWSEFGRRPNENASRGTDHSTASQMFIIGNPVKGGLYGEHPSLEATQLDNGGNMKFTTDFRQVYAEILDKWLGADSQTILGARYNSVGFL
jgi:uncharacterized protein (DUF1501 family)